ncbi:MAG: prolyl aminopeptidase [Acidiferrobacterales bacterium]|nr:prolyl aminopeptidase [Acidiferrobacterales bacterium]
MTNLLSFFDPIAPYDQGLLSVGNGHQIYYEQSGNPAGKAAVYLHGGPGSGSNPNQRRVFNPEKYRIILFDQRGCGRSQPNASLDHNTTWDLVEDMETLRQHLQIEKWQVCGGSWGSTLSLAYAILHSEAVSELILRGIFTLRKRELDWYYQGGAAHLFPDCWEKFVDPIPNEERGDMIQAYYRRLTGNDATEKKRVATSWSQWEGSTINLQPRPKQVEHYGENQFAEAFARIETHYFVNHGFFEEDGWLLNNVDKIKHIPATIIQGRYDICTPMRTAWDLHLAFPEADFYIIDDAAHAFDEPGITDRLIKTTNRYARF